MFLSYFILMLIHKISHFVKAISKISIWFSFMFKHVLYGLLKHFTFEFGLWTRYFSTLFVVVNQKPSVNIANTLWRISPERKKNSRLILDDSLISKDNNGDLLYRILNHSVIWYTAFVLIDLFLSYIYPVFLIKPHLMPNITNQ